MASPPEHLSPSSWNLYEQCPRKWADHYVYGHDEPATAAMEVGTFQHRTHEKLMLEVPGCRTVDAALEWATELWAFPQDLWRPRGSTEPSPPRPTSIERGEISETQFKNRSWSAIEGLWSLEEPAEVNVVSTEERIEWTEGDVPMVCVVDRVDEVKLDDGSPGFSVVDYKSGAVPKPKYRDKHMRQITIGAMAVADRQGPLSLAPHGALLYVSADKVVKAPTDRSARETQHRAAQGVWSDILQACEDEDFPAKAGPLCGWCPLAGDCREGRAVVNLALSSGKLTGDEPGARAVMAPWGA